MIDSLNAIVARSHRHDFCQEVICTSGIVRADSRANRLRKWAAVALLVTVTGACGVQHVGNLQHHLQCRTLNSYQHIQGCQVALILIRVPTTSHQFFQMTFWMAQ